MFDDKNFSKTVGKFLSQEVAGEYPQALQRHERTGLPRGRLQ